MKNKRGFIVSLLCVLLVMAVIWCFSARTADESSEDSGGIVSWVLSVILPGSVNPETYAAIEHVVTLVVRKTGHFAEFSLLGFCLYNHMRYVEQYIPLSHPRMAAWVIGTLYAASDEIHQIFVPGRGPAVKDVLLDSAGVIFGITLFSVVLLIFRRVKKHD